MLMCRAAVVVVVIDVDDGRSEEQAYSQFARVSCAQSTATRIRLSASAGTSRRSPCEAQVEEREFPPEGSARPGEHHDAVLAELDECKVHREHDPRASPSGFSCEVTRNRSPDRIAPTTAAMSVFGWLIGRLCRFVGISGPGSRSSISFVIRTPRSTD